MAEPRQEDMPPDGVKETDIVFDCPHCGKSLAVDYLGAGLKFPCADCGMSVEAPIPEGMELSDLDSNTELQEFRIINLRESLTEAQARVSELQTEVEELTDRRESLERSRMNRLFRFGAITEKIGILERALDDMTKAIRRIAELAREEARAEAREDGAEDPPASG